MSDTATPFVDLLDRIEARLATRTPDAELATMADAQLAEAEGVVEAWLAGRGDEPTGDEVEGFRLLALHRQGARGDPGFNACRETCREIVYLRNVIRLYADDTTQARHHLRLQSMVLRHLALFIGGRMIESGLGDFCCSSRPVRTLDAESISRDKAPPAARARRA